MKHLSILGSTGSIGTSALDIVRMHPDRFKVRALTAAKNIDLLSEQIHFFQPELAAVLDEQTAVGLSRMLKGSWKPEIVWGESGFIEAASYGKSDAVLLAMVGAAGLKPALAAIEKGKQIALANKETLVMAGEIVKRKAGEKQVSILPVDSEHSAIYQCLKGSLQKDLKTVFLTASGGPFRSTPVEEFKNISVDDALNHPTWNMGKKITIDSATLMNKALEIVEAVFLFDLPPEKIQVLVHPQSIIHSMVGFMDGSIMAQMGKPDMKSAIAYALTEPDRIDLNIDFPSFSELHALTFEPPDTSRFPSIEFAYEACRKKGTLPAVMNAANEEAVTAFLERQISFPDIFRLVSKAMEHHTLIDKPDLSIIIEADLWAREKIKSWI